MSTCAQALRLGGECSICSQRVIDCVVGTLLVERVLELGVNEHDYVVSVAVASGLPYDLVLLLIADCGYITES